MPRPFYRPKKLSRLEVLGVVREMAEAAQLQVEPIVSQSGENLLMKLAIGGYRCLLLHGTRSFRPKRSKRRYVRMNVSVSSAASVDAVVVLVDVKKYERSAFVIPVSHPAVQPRVSEDGAMRMYLPIEDLPPYNNRRPAVDWRLFRNAWHLLKAGPMPGPKA